MGGSHLKPVHRDSQEVIPEAAIRPSAENENYHTGVSVSFPPRLSVLVGL